MKEKHNVDRPLVRLYSSKNYQRFAQEATQIGFSNVTSSDNVNDAYGILDQHLAEMHNQCFPLVRVSRSKAKSKPWVTKGIKKSIHKKNSLYRQYIQKPSPESKTKLTRYRHFLNKILEVAESQYYKDILESQYISAKKAWSLINNVINNKPKRKSSTIKCINHNNASFTNNKDIANAFNNYFSNIGKHLASNLPTRNLQCTDYLDPPVNNTIFLTPIDKEEVLQEISKLKPGKAPGMDNIKGEIIKTIAHVIGDALVHVFNLCFTSGVYPDILKIAKVIPLYKKGNNTLPENYRPISLLPIINKLLERLIEKRLRAFLQNHNVFYEYQFGFRTGYSTSFALLEITNNIHHHLDKGENVLGLYLDLKKAFDTVNHSILKTKLKHYGIRGACHDLITSYLTNRVQYMFVNGTFSDPTEVNTGVPQGSVLGPLLFLIYVNDIKNVTPDISIRLFADDTNVFIHNKSCDLLIDNIKQTIKKLKTWFDVNKLTVHLGKTNYTIFHGKKQKVHTCHDKFSVDGIDIIRTPTTKYLGVIIDEELSWKHHIDELSKQLVKYTGIFYKTRSKFPITSKFQLYYAFVYSRISYCIEVYGAAKPSVLQPLQVMQNRILKILTCTPMRFPTDTLYSQWGTLKLNEIHLFKMYIILFKYTHGNLPTFFNKILNPNAKTVQANTRQNHLFTATRPNTRHGHLVLNNYCIKIWNQLPNTIKTSTSLSTFKTILKQFLLNKYA